MSDRALTVAAAGMLAGAAAAAVAVVSMVASAGTLPGDRLAAGELAVALGTVAALLLSPLVALVMEPQRRPARGAPRDRARGPAGGAHAPQAGAAGRQLPVRRSAPAFTPGRAKVEVPS